MQQSSTDAVEEEKEERLQRECFKYMADFAKIIYENEERRETSLIQQASQMQTAFSFVIAAVFVVATIVIDHRGPLSFEFILLTFSSITVALLVSLFSATMAQNRYKRDDFPMVSMLKNKVFMEYDNFRTDAQRNKYLLDTYEVMHTSYANTNDKRKYWVSISMKSFYTSLVLCIFWFIVGICKII